jgi:antitoxin component YwqK of YwqJK toxin-antitoxin module
MRWILFIGCILVVRFAAHGQRRKIIFDEKQTNYYTCFVIYSDIDFYAEHELNDSLPDGLYAFYNNLDTTYLMYEMEFKKRKRHGYYRSYYKNRQLKEEIFYKAGKKQFSKQFYMNGRLQWETTIPYFVYNSNGTEKTYYPGGQLELLSVHKHHRGKLTSYYEGGQTRSVNSYLITKEGGFCTISVESFYPDGKVRYTAFFKNCRGDGFVPYFDEKGKKEKEELYAYGHRCFEFTFPKNCDKTFDTTFGNGYRLTGEYRDCKKTGTWKYYKREYGELKPEKEKLYELEKGKFYKLEKEELYENDALIRTIKH